jgi:hypothetical protein
LATPRLRYSGGAVALFPGGNPAMGTAGTTLGAQSLSRPAPAEQATRYSGVNTVRVQISVYVIFPARLGRRHFDDGEIQLGKSRIR